MSRDLLKIIVMMGAISVAHSFSILGLMLSGPAALCCCRFCNSFLTSFSVTFMLCINGVVLFPRSGRGSLSGLVKTEENWRLSIFALSHEFDFKNPSSLKGATPDASFFLLFMKLQTFLAVPCLCSEGSHTMWLT